VRPADVIGPNSGCFFGVQRRIEEHVENRVIIGGQWGDEGKGKIIDAFGEGFDWVLRYQGGANAGHTIRSVGPAR